MGVTWPSRDRHQLWAALWLALRLDEVFFKANHGDPRMEPIFHLLLNQNDASFAPAQKHLLTMPRTLRIFLQTSCFCSLLANVPVTVLSNMQMEGESSFRDVQGRSQTTMVR
eukprot:752331-Amphidinium_carterae.1